MTNSSPVWAITCFFNPSRYRRRKLNYLRFRRSLHVPLVTVELSLDGQFELDQSDAEIMVRRTGATTIWHKEALLNIALQSVPEDVPYLAWLDCDVILDREDWAEGLVSELRTNQMAATVRRTL